MDGAKENANPTVHQVSKSRISSKKRLQSYTRRDIRSGKSDVDGSSEGGPQTAGELAWRQIRRFNVDSESLSNVDSPNEARRITMNRPLLSFAEEELKEMTDEELAAPPCATLHFAATSYRSASERAVHLALQHVANDEGGDDPTHEYVGLLRDAGFVLPASTAGTSLLARVPPSVVTFEATDDDFLAPSTLFPAACKCLRDVFDAAEVFDMIRNIQDPEHPLTLQQLNVVNINHVLVVDKASNQFSATNSEATETPSKAGHTAVEGVDERDRGEKRQGDNVDQSPRQLDHPTVDVRFTPTIPHCSMATLIGLCIRVKLLRSLPSRFKVTVRINPGTHASEHAINKQLDDKERVRAALENSNLRSVVDKCIAAQELRKPRKH